MLRKNSDIMKTYLSFVLISIWFLTCQCNSQQKFNPTLIVNSPLDPTKTFTIVREHQYNFTNNPAAGLVLLEGGWGATTITIQGQPALPADGTTPAPGDIQFALGNINPCNGVISTIHNFVITGIEVSSPEVITPAPSSSATLSGPFLKGIRIVEVPGTGPAIRRLEEHFIKSEFGWNFHDPIGIRMAGNSAFQIHTRVEGSAYAQFSGGDVVITPALVRVVVSICGYCADEVLFPPQNN